MREESKTPILHIGYHKTGTTFLQKRLFEKFPDLFLRVPQREIFNALIYPKPLIFEVAGAVSFVETHVLKAKVAGLIPVFSNERLSGGPHNGGYDSKEVAERLKKVVPHGKVIIIFREQRDMIYSLYGQYVKAIGSCSLQEYLKPSTKKNSALWDFSFLEYHRLVELYCELFGKQNVLALPFELLRNDQQDFMKRILDFIGIDEMHAAHIQQQTLPSKVNEALSPVEISLKRFFNPSVMKGHPNVGKTLYSQPIHALYKLLRWVVQTLPLRGVNERLRKKRRRYIQEQVQNRYSISNQRMQEITGIDLSRFGYNTELKP